MRKGIWLAVFAVLVVVFVVRQRLYVRDPLGSLSRNGVAEAGAQVFLNPSNEVLLENDNSPAYVLVLQHGGHVGTPARLSCLHFLVCLMDADVVTLVQARPEIQVQEMTGKSVIFKDENGKQAVIALR